jgi:hypothetical protein
MATSIETYVWERNHLETGAQQFGGAPQIRPPLPADEWKQVDLVIERTLHEVANRAGLETVLALTSGDAEAASSITYVYLEPFAHVVVAFSRGEHKVSISADEDLWETAQLEREFWQLIALAEQILQTEALPKAIISIAQKTSEILCARGNWARIDRD